MMHVPDSILKEVKNVYDNLISSDYPAGYYAGALLQRDEDGHYAVNGFEPRWSAADAWGIDCYDEEDETVVGFFGHEQHFLDWYREMVEAGVLPSDPDDADLVRACRDRAAQSGSWREIYEPPRG